MLSLSLHLGLQIFKHSKESANMGKYLLCQEDKIMNFGKF